MSLLQRLKMIVLVADDNPDSRRQLQIRLSSNGFDVLTASNGAEALARALQTPPDVIISDILMPVMDGFSLCRAWKRDEKLHRIPFIFHSATYADENDRAFALSIGAERFIVKPEEPEILVKTIQDVITASRERPSSDGGRDASLPVKDEDYLQQYNATLVRKLEVKMQELGKINRELEHGMADRARVEQALRTVSECNQALVRAPDEPTLLTDICRILVDFGRYRFVWVGFALEDEKKSVMPVAYAGFDESYIQQLHISWDDTERGRGPTGTAIRTGEPVVMHDISQDEHFAPWRSEAMKRGYAASVALPLKQDGRAFGALNIYTDRADAFDDEEMRLLRQLANDLAYGVMTLRMRARHAQVESALRTSEAKYRELVQNANSIILRWTRDGKITFLNEFGQRFFGYTEEEIYGRHVVGTIVPEAETGGRDLSTLMDQVCADPMAFEQNINENMRRDGSRVWISWTNKVVLNAKGEVAEILSIGADITERRTLEKDLMTMAHYDVLTRLPNRTFFLEKAATAMARARRNRSQFAVLFVDLDHFKGVNDTLGHSVGDELLKDTAVKIASCIRETDMMARLGGDEFIVFLDDLEDGQRAQYTAERIREKFNVPRMIAGNDLFITASVGIAVYPGDGDSLEDLLKNADTAMYAAKAAGRNAYCFFNADMNKRAVTKMQVDRGLRDALEKKEFSLVYQPIVNVMDGRVRGFEALLRWFKTEGGLVFPDEFISVAEETGLIVPIGEWVLHEACRFNQELVKAGYEHLVMSVNISVAQLRRKNLPDVIRGALEESGLRPELLEVEVTESLFIESFDAAIEVLNAIRSLGVRVALDDFGTGYSSLGHLKELPIMNLKIDRLFIKEIAKDSDENEMIPAIIDLAHKLKLKVVAEGVETAVQLEKLAGNRCDYYQGYFFSRPIPADKVLPFLEKSRQAGAV